jgi:hypothetical protein
MDNTIPRKFTMSLDPLVTPDSPTLPHSFRNDCGCSPPQIIVGHGTEVGINPKAVSIGQYGTSVTKKLLGGKINTRDGKLLYMAGGGGEGVNRGLEKKKVSGCRFFLFRHPLGARRRSQLLQTMGIRQWCSYSLLRTQSVCIRSMPCAGQH